MDTLTATISKSVSFIDASIRFIIGLSIVLLLSLVLACSYRQKIIKKRDKILQLLLNIFIPTAVSWEHDYSKLFKYSKNEGQHMIRMPLSSLLQTLCRGGLELRDENDFAPLLSGRLRVSGWTIGLKIEFVWWIRAFCRITLDKHFPGMYRSPTPGPLPELTSGHLENEKDGLSQALLYDLDLIPYGYLETAIRGIKRSHLKDNSVVFEFSTVGRDVSHSSPSFLICSVPFLEDESRKRISTPLLSSLHRVVELLSDYGFKIQSICDVSSSHAKILQQKTHHLVADTVIRTSFTSSDGLEHWRKARLLLTWEAALLADGHMTRWRILCSPNTIRQAYIVNP